MNKQNDQLVLVCGTSGSGKSFSIRGLRNPDKWVYLNAENKRLPFNDGPKDRRIIDPLQVYGALDRVATDDEIEGGIIDTLTFLMNKYEEQYVLTSSNTMKAWSEYKSFFNNMMDKVAVCNKPVVFLAHTRDDLDERSMEIKTAVPVKGSLKNEGVEAYFSTVVATKRVSLKELEGQESDLLTITEEEKELGLKHVYQTRITAKTIGERIRSPFGLFPKNMTYIDNNLQILIDYLTEYYK